MKSHRGGFTLIELMIVVAIIALIAVIALPSFLRARQRAQNTKFINALRVASGAFDTYAIEHGKLSARRVPQHRAARHGRLLQFQPGFYRADPHWRPVGLGQGRFDGNLVTGHFQEKGGGRYSHILE